jgi:RHS repeat-associated protein
VNHHPLSRIALYLINAVIIVSMVLGPLLASVPQAWARSAEAPAYLSPTERFSDWPRPTVDTTDPFALSDSQSLALERALSGLDNELRQALQLEALPLTNFGITSAHNGPDNGQPTAAVQLSRQDVLDVTADKLRPTVSLPAVSSPLAALGFDLPSVLGLEDREDEQTSLENEATDENDIDEGVVGQRTSADKTEAVFLPLKRRVVLLDEMQPKMAVNTVTAVDKTISSFLTTTNAIYLPFIGYQADLNSPESAMLMPNQANFVSFDNGRLQLTTMAGSVDEPTTLIFQKQPATSVDGYPLTLNRFSLNAFANGQPVTQFNLPLALSVKYDDQPELDTERLHLFYFDDVREVWTAVPSQVDVENGRVLASLDHFTDFALLMTDTCADLILEPIPEEIQPAFTQACNRVSLATLGPQISSAYSWAGTWGVNFEHGPLIYNSAEEAAYFIHFDLFPTYQNIGGPASFLGLPTADTDPGGPPETFRDENYDFRGSSYSLFTNGFIGSSDGTISAHRFFPQIMRVFFRSEPVNDDYTELTFGAMLDPAPETSASATAELYAEFSNGDTWEQSTTLGAPFTAAFEYPGQIPITSTDTVEFYWRLERSGSSDPLIGYAPCLYYDHQQSYGPFIIAPDNFQDIEVGCEGDADGPGDFLPPVINFLEIWPDGQGNLSILVHITDNSGLIASADISGEPGTFSTLVEWAPDVYAATVTGIPNNEIVTFTVTAADPSGNSASAVGNSRSPFRGRYGLACLGHLFNNNCNPCIQSCAPGWDRLVGNPVIPSTGAKVERLPIISVPGPGQSDIDIALTYTSQNNEIGLTGQGWSFPYQMSLTPRHNPLLIGVEVVYPDGRLVLFADNEDGTFTAVTPDIHDRIEVNGDGYTLIQKSLNEYDFDSEGRLTAERDRNGNEIQFSYSGEQLVQISNDAGRTISLGYNGDGYITTISAPEDKIYTLTYEGSRLVGFTDARNGSWSYTYEENYLGTLLNVEAEEYEAYDYYLTQSVTPKGHDKNRQNYDERGWVIEQWVGGRDYRQFDYDETANTTTITDALGRVTVYHYDENGRLIRLNHPDGTHELFDYDDDFNRIYHRDQEGREWHWTFDDRGNRLTESGSLDWSREWNYNDLDRITRLQDPLGRESFIEYDDRGNPITITQADESSSTITYDERGLPTDVYDFNGNHTRNEYDPLTGDLLQTWDGEDHLTQFAYDDLGRPVTITWANSSLWTYEYDGNDNLIRQHGPLGYEVRYEFDANDNLILETDPNGGEIHYDYDESDMLVEVTDQNDGLTRFVYDNVNNLVELRDAENRVWTFAYDAVNNRIAEHGPEDTHTFMAYDGVGNLVYLTRCLNTPVGNECADNQTTLFVHDDLDRLVELVENYVPGADPTADTNVMTSFSYDLAGNVRSVTDGNGHTTHYDYDDLNRLIREEDAEGQITYLDYDHQGNLVYLEDAEGRVWTFVYDGTHNLVAEHGPEDSHTFYTYDGMGDLVEMMRCNSPLLAGNCALNQVTHYEYDLLQRPITLIENYIPDATATADTNVTTRFEYDLAGNLLTLIDAEENETHFAYDLLHRLIREENAEGEVTRYVYDNMGNLTAITNPRNYTTHFIYDDLDRLVERHDAADGIWTYSYDRLSNLIEQVDAEGIVTHYIYDGLERPFTLIQNYRPGLPATADQNVTTHFEYDAVGNLLLLHDPRGVYTTEHQYDRVNRRVLTIDAEGGQTRFVYDRVGNLRQVIDANGQPTTMAYDDRNRQIRITNAEGHSVHFTYDPLSNLVNLTDARAHTTTFAYDGMNRPILMVDAAGGEWQYSYDAVGNLQQEIDANGNANHSYTYDKVYRVLTITDAEGHTDSFTYDPNGNRLTWTDGNDHTTTYAYNELDWLIATTNAENETTGYAYDRVGNQTQLIEADGVITLYGYDPLYRLTAVTLNHRPDLPAGVDTNVITRYEYDEVGNLLLIIDGNGHETEFSYDGMNRLVQEVDADGHIWQYEYDPVGNRTLRIDANGYRTEYSYYPDNQLQRIEYDLDGTTVAYVYDENNNRIGMTDHLGTTAWVYDELNRTTSATDAFGRTLLYGYDAVGNRTSLTYPDGLTVTYGYYANNWLEIVTDPEDNVTHYERDGVGYPLVITNPNDTVAEMEYDKANRLLTLVNRQTTGAERTNSAFAYTYNEIGHRVQMVAEYAWRQPSVVTYTYSYDGLRRLVRDETSEGVWTEYAFDHVGNRLLMRTNDNSTTPRPFDEQTLTYSYSPANRLLTVVGDTHPGQPSTKRVDNVGQTIHAFYHHVSAQAGKHIEADAAAHLLSLAADLIDLLEGNPAPGPEPVAEALATLRQQVETYRDEGLIGNQGIAHSLLVKLNLGEQANNETSGDLQTQTFTYDDNGNRINKEFPGPQGPQIQGTDYSYDPENRLVVAQDYQMNQQGNRVDRGVTELDYDGNGRRLVKAYNPNLGGGGEKRIEYVFDGWDPVAEYNTWNPQHTNYYRGGGGQIITMHDFPAGTQGQMVWFHYNGLGSVSGLTKHQGQAHHNYRYHAYGQIEMPPGNFTDPHNHYTFTGQALDENIGIYEFFARAYDFSTGVWLQQDPYRGNMVDPQSLHRYGYVKANPVSYFDSYGYSACKHGDWGNGNCMTWSEANIYCRDCIFGYDSALYNVTESVVEWGPSRFAYGFTSQAGETISSAYDMTARIGKSTIYYSWYDQKGFDAQWDQNYSDAIAIRDWAERYFANPTSALAEDYCLIKDSLVEAWHDDSWEFVGRAGFEVWLTVLTAGSGHAIKADKATKVVKTTKIAPKKTPTPGSNNYQKRFRDSHGRDPLLNHDLHHGYPQQFEDFFGNAGIDINSPDNIFELPRDLHTRKPDGIHTGPRQESWNGQWQTFIEQNPHASPGEIIRFRDHLADEFGIADYLGGVP